MSEQLEKYIEDLKQERDYSTFAKGGYAAGLQYAINLLKGKKPISDAERGQISPTRNTSRS